MVWIKLNFIFKRAVLSSLESKKNLYCKYSKPIGMKGGESIV